MTKRQLFFPGRLLVCLGFLMVSGGSFAQTVMPWWWESASPTIPNYTTCAGHPPVDLGYITFALGCINVQTGAAVQCHEDWHEYFSIDGVEPSQVLSWQGWHTHPRPTDVRTATGGIYSDLSGLGDPSRITGDTGPEFWTALKYLPQASGVVRITARGTFPYGWYVVPNRWWHVDPADPSRRTALAEIAVAIGVPGLVQLPDDPSYVKVRNPGDHPQGDYVTPTMAGKLSQLAQAYRQAYYTVTHKWVKLSFNDMSLPWGGVFDLNDNWDCPHNLHRLGRSVDVNHACPVDGGGTTTVYEDKLNELAQSQGLKRYEQDRIHYELVQ